MAAQLRRTLDGFATRYQEVEGLLQIAKRKGVEVSDAEFSLLDVHTVFVSAVNLTHGLDTAEIDKTLAGGEKELLGVRASAVSAVKEASFRRLGLIVATVLLALFAAALALKVRRMGRARREEGSGGAHGPKAS